MASTIPTPPISEILADPETGKINEKWYSYLSQLSQINSLANTVSGLSTGATASAWAYVSFGTSYAVAKAHNITSVTSTATGHIRVNFTTAAIADANYAVSAITDNTTGSEISVETRTTAAVSVRINIATTTVDAPFSVIIYD